jgi:hypothetical protein
VCRDGALLRGAELRGVECALPLQLPELPQL